MLMDFVYANEFVFRVSVFLIRELLQSQKENSMKPHDSEANS